MTIYWIVLFRQTRSFNYTIFEINSRILDRKERFNINLSTLVQLEKLDGLVWLRLPSTSLLSLFHIERKYLIGDACVHLGIRAYWRPDLSELIRLFEGMRIDRVETKFPDLRKLVHLLEKIDGGGM